jgi:hypothetical protein
VVNGPDLRGLVIPFSGGYSAQPIWRHTSVASLTTGQTYTTPLQILGFEWDTYGPAGVSTSAASFMAAPHPLTRYCSNVTYSISSGLLLTDAGDEYLASGTATHRLVVYPGGNGGMVFGTGTVNWALGCDDANTYQQGNNNVDPVIQQGTVNVLVDMGAAPASLMFGLTQPSQVDWFVVEADAALAVTATLTAAGSRTGPAQAALAATASLSAGGTRTALPAAALTATATLTAVSDGAAAVSAAAALTVTVTLTVAASRSGAAGAVLSVAATLTAGSGSLHTTGAALTALATLIASVTSGLPDGRITYRPYSGVTYRP